MSTQSQMCKVAITHPKRSNVLRTYTIYWVNWALFGGQSLNGQYVSIDIATSHKWSMKNDIAPVECLWCSPGFPLYRNGCMLFKITPNPFSAALFRFICTLLLQLIL